MMFQRDRQPESMDDPKLPPEDHFHALRGLATLNRISGISGAMYRHLRRYALARPDYPLRVLDVASGGGDVPIRWAKRAKSEGIDLRLTLLDISPVAIEQQRRLASQSGVDVLSLQQDCLSTPLPEGFDVVTCSLFMHHLDDHQTFRLLQAIQLATDHAMVVADLERSRLNWGLVKISSHLLTRSWVVHHDGPLSVRGAYTAEEFKRVAESALARPVQVERSFPCRFIATFCEEAIFESVPAFA